MESDILDQVEEGKKFIFSSKLSILITSIIFSPFWGVILYCSNLRTSHQKGKINRTIITVLISYLMTRLPLIGFEYPEGMYILSIIFSRFIVGLLLVLVIWKKQFENIEYQSAFQWGTFIVIALLQLAISFLSLWINSGHFSSLELPINTFYFDFSIVTSFAFLFFFTFGDFIYRLFKKTKPPLQNH